MSILDLILKLYNWLNFIVFSFLQMFLGEYPEQWYSEHDSRFAVQKFRAKLEAIENEIVKRNKTLDVEYFYLCPSHVPNSITI